MAQLQCIGLYKPYIDLPFGDCAMYFDHGREYPNVFIYIYILAGTFESMIFFQGGLC